MTFTATNIYGATLRGVEAIPVALEVDMAPGLPFFMLVGLAEGAVRESKTRVESAIKNSGLVYPLARIIVNLSPAHLRKDGTGFDLPLARAMACSVRSPGRRLFRA